MEGGAPKIPYHLKNVQKESEVKHPGRVFFFSEENTWTIPGVSKAAINDNDLCSTPDCRTDCFATHHNARAETCSSLVNRPSSIAV